MSRTSRSKTSGSSKARASRVISHPDELAGLSVLPWRRLGGAGQIRIADDSVDAETRGDWQNRLNRLYFACGCPEGATGTLIALAAYVVGWLALRPDLGVGGTIAAGFAAAVVGGIAGKVVGLRAADRALQVEIRRISDAWRASPRAKDEEFIFCG